MQISRRRAALATLIGSGANTAIVSLQAVILIPLYLRVIGPRVYGAWLGSGDFLVWMQAFDLGLPNFIIQRIGAAHGRKDTKLVAEYFATGALSLAVVAVIVQLIALMLAMSIPGWMGLRGAEAHVLQSCFFLGSIAASMNIFLNSVVGFSRGVQKTTLMNTFQILASICGFVGSLILVLEKSGLWAIPLGMLIRTSVLSVGATIFVLMELKRERMFRYFRIRFQLLREVLAIIPATALGGLSYAAMNQSETALVAIMYGPEMAAVFSITRKAIDLARSLVDTIGVAAYGSFAHLVTSDQRHRAMHVHSEITSLRISLATAIAAAYVAVNWGVVSLWVGQANFGGLLLTILIALQFIVVGGSYLMNYLYRAAGAVMKGSVALLAESMVRVPLMVVLLYTIGLPGIPLAGIVTASFFGVWMYRRTSLELSKFAGLSTPTPAYVWFARVSVFSLGLLLCIFRWDTWPEVIAIGSSLVLCSGFLLLYIDPLMGDLRFTLWSAVNKFHLKRLYE
jgi:O-antigen/teichoic acid export membrane protein